MRVGNATFDLEGKKPPVTQPNDQLHGEVGLAIHTHPKPTALVPLLLVRM